MSVSVPANDPAARLLLTIAPTDLEKFWDVLTNVPVPVGAVADRLGIDVLSTTLDPNISGLIKRKQGGQFEIQVNDLDSPVRQRFTVCHEIGHYLLHRKLIDDVGIQDNILYRSNLTGRQESEANRVAAAILLPWETVQNWHQANFSGPVAKENLKAVATQFKASDLAVGYRFGIQMTIFTRKYYPTICLRRGEMLALEKLPDDTKSSILPIILLAPWVNSMKFENTFKIIEKSYEGLPIIVDIDRYYKSENLLESRTYFWSLKDPIEGPQRWMDLVEAHQNYIPCIQMVGVSEELVIKQVDWARDLGRGFCLRYEIDRFETPAFNRELLNYISNDNYVIVVDFGYHDFSGSVLERISVFLTGIFDVSSSAKVVVTGSNFPNDFEEFDNFARSQPNSAREIYSNILQRFGNYSVFYGDWASAKPRDYDGRGSPPRPRVDYPTRTSWIFARSKEEEWDFQDAATRITRLPEWEQRPKIWGTGMIEKAAMGLPGGIKNHPDVIASRINIHLFVQANADGAIPPVQPVSKWKDPI